MQVPSNEMVTMLKDVMQRPLRMPHPQSKRGRNGRDAEKVQHSSAVTLDFEAQRDLRSGPEAHSVQPEIFPTHPPNTFIEGRSVVFSSMISAGQNETRQLNIGRTLSEQMSKSRL